MGGGLSLINGKTLVETTVSDTSGWCHISLVQPLFSGIILLHMTLNGRGSRLVGAPRTPITACLHGADTAHQPSPRCALVRTLCTVRTARGQQHHLARARAVREIIDTLTLAMRQHGCEDVVCVVNMSEARGASPFALPCVAGFVVSHRCRRRLKKAERWRG